MTQAPHRRLACETSFHFDGGRRRAAASLLARLMATTALTVALHGIALADGGAGGGLGGGAGGTGYTGASGSDAAQTGMYLHGGGGGGAAGGGVGGVGGPGAGPMTLGKGGAGGTGGLNNENGAPTGDGSDGGNGGVSGMGSGGGSGGGGGMGGAGYYYTSDIDLSLDSQPADIQGGKGGAGGKGYPQGGAGGKGGDGGGGVVMADGFSVVVDNESVAGGAGGKGGDGANAGDPGTAGKGGNGGGGVVVSGGGDVTVDSSGASVVVTGGRGGDGGNGNSTGNQAHGGDGGAGGAGIEAAGGGDVTVDNGTIQGGDGGTGGNGGSSAAAGNGGAGGAGIDAAGATSVTVGTDGTVTGGAGGAGGTTSTPGSAGAGGVGIIASGGITVTVAGSVSGGMSGDTSPVQADAIDLTGGGNTLKLEDGFSFTGNVVSDGTGAGDTLELGGDTDSGFDLSGLGSAFTDFAALDKTGTSTWTLTNSSDFSGPTTVSDGTLALDAASLANSAVTVDTDGTLSASGASAVKSVDVSGAVTLSTATTTLTAAGGATFETDSTFNVTVDSSGNASKIDSGIGAAIIDGGEVMVTAGTGAYSPTTQYVIVTGQSVSDTFDGAEMAAGSPFLTPSLHYDVTDEVYLTFATDFGSAANTYNQQQVAGALDAWGLGGPLSAYLLNLDDDTAPAAYDTLSGDVYASIKTALLDDSHIVRDAMEDRLLASSDNGKNVWGKVFGNWDSYDGNGNAAGFSNQTTGVLFGADGILGDWRLGGLIGYGRGAFSVPDRSSSADVDGYHVGLYAGTGTGSLQFRAGAGFTSHQIAMSRDVAFGDFSDSLSGDYTADVAQGFAELGYTLDMGGASIQPFANLAGVALHTDGFAENGGDAALTVAAGDEDVTLTTLGFHASAGLGTFATANATVGWQHAFGATPHSDMAFESGDAFDVAGVPLAADAAIVKAALDLALAPAATLSLIYGGQFATGAIDQSANADLSVKF